MPPALPPVVFTAPSSTPGSGAPDAIFTPPGATAGAAPQAVFTPPSNTPGGEPDAIFTPPSSTPGGAPVGIFSAPSSVASGMAPSVRSMALQVDALAAQAIAAVDERIAGKLPADALHLFSNTTANWASATFVPNRNLWCEDLRPFLTGVHMYGGSYHQSYGLQAITPRHMLDCGHGGITVGNALRFVNVDGEVFNTSILRRITDNDTPQYVTDLSIYLTAHELPAWVHKATILQMSTEAKARLTAAGVPTVAVSQGNWTTGPTDANTPKNRKVYLKQFDLSFRPPNRLPWLHQVAVGDSGTPEFLMTGDQLRLIRIITTAPSGGGVFPGDYLELIQSMIERADAAASISTGYTPRVESVGVPGAPTVVFDTPTPPTAVTDWGTMTITGITHSGSPVTVPPLLYGGTYQARPFWTNNGAGVFGGGATHKVFYTPATLYTPAIWMIEGPSAAWGFASESNAANPLGLTWTAFGDFAIGGDPSLSVASQPGGGLLPPPAITGA